MLHGVKGEVISEQELTQLSLQHKVKWNLKSGRETFKKIGARCSDV